MDCGCTEVTRLYGCRRYDSMEEIGRVESGTETDSYAGAVPDDYKEVVGRVKQDARAEKQFSANLKWS